MMGLKSRIIEVTARPLAQREALADELLAVDLAVFDDQTSAETREMMLGLHDDEVWVMTLEADDKVVGYNIIRISHLEFEGKIVACWKSRAAVLPGFRGKNRTAKFPAILYPKYCLRHPFRKIYGLVTLLHPSSFKLLSDNIPLMYPYPKSTLDGREQELYGRLFQFAGLDHAPGRAPFVARFKTTTRMDALEVSYWQNSNHPAIAFFLANNPDHWKGQAIISFFRINVSLFAGMAAQRLDLSGKLRQLWMAVNPKARRNAHAKMLNAVLGANKLDEGLLQKIAHSIELVRVPSQGVLIQYGKAQDSIYCLVSGSLLVHLETSKGSVTVDQLAAGAIVGEIGALLHVPATATVQAMGKCTLLRLGPAAIEMLRKEDPALMGHLKQLMQSRLEMNRERDSMWPDSMGRDSM